MFPVLWHVTPAVNVERIRRTKVLESAAALMSAAGDQRWLRQKRPWNVPLDVAGESVLLRNQRPLHDGHIAWEDGWNRARLLEELNKRVFFWPGDDRLPTKRARRNVEHFLASGDYVVLRLPFAAVRSTPGVRIEYCRCNTGAPRTVNRQKAVRGPSIFKTQESWEEPASKVREVAVVHQVPLAAFWDHVRFDSALSP